MRASQPPTPTEAPCLPAAAPQQLNSWEMQQTWAELKRSRRLPLSAAQCLVDMPPVYSIEPAPKPPAVDSQSLLTIGLHPMDGGRSVRRTTHFTSDFRDPFA